MTDHPITPSPELLEQWEAEGAHTTKDKIWHVVAQAARWGADRELEACCAWVQGYAQCGDSLHAARRPKPLSLAEKALEEVGTFEGMGTCNIDIIRRALERLQELEGQGDD